MVFTSDVFLFAFLPIVLAVYYALPRYRNEFLSGGIKYAITPSLHLLVAGNESISRPNYNNIGPDDPHGGAPILGTPRAPVPPIPTTDAGIVAVNPPAGSGRDGSQPQPSPGLGTLLAPLAGGK